MYAWTNFVTERNEQGQPTRTVKAGEKVSQQDLGVTDLDWQALIESGCLREQPYPTVPDNISPAEYFRSQESRMRKGELSREEVQERTQFQLPL